MRTLPFPLIAPLLVLAFTLLMGAASARGAELVTLGADNYEAYAPKGKEARAFMGDYVLRNDKIVVAVADPKLLSGRSASRWAIANVSGAIVDLTLRDKPNDQIIAFYPAPLRYKPDAPNTQAELIDERLAATQPDRQPVSGPRVQLKMQPYEVASGRMLEELAKLPAHLRGEPQPYVEVTYTLEEGWPYVLVETVYHNPTREAWTPGPFARIVAGDTAEPISDDDARFVAIADKWWGQAWGVVAEGHRLKLAKTGAGAYTIGFIPEGGNASIPAGGSLRVARRVFPAANASDLKAIAAPLLGRPVRSVPLELSNAAYAKAGAEVAMASDWGTVVMGRTDAEGKLTLTLPPGDCSIHVTPFGGKGQTITVPAGQAGPVKVECPEPARVVVTVKDENGKSIPGKIRFTGVEGTPDPFFFPNTGEEAVGNVCYTINGELSRIVPPGQYDVTVSYGPEYDPVTKRVKAQAAGAGEPAVVAASLRHSVKTPGWISAELHNHSTMSGRTEQFYVYPYDKDRTVDGDSTASPLGRVLNLICEQIEFAPATEHNFVYSYEPIVKQLKAEVLLATCPGVGMTAGRRHTTTHQNTFPVVWEPGRQDGGALQRPEHIGQVEWLAKWNDGADKLVQVALPRGDGFRPTRNMDVLDVVDLRPLIDGKAYATPAEGDSRILQWIEILNEGYRFPGVVNAGAFDNLHGSGRLRNYVKSPTDDPASIKPMDVVQAVRRGQVVMTTGPFLEVVMNPGSPKPAIPGGEIRAADGKAELLVRVQANNAVAIDRVQVLVNGRRDSALTFSRTEGKTEGSGFREGPLQFERTIPLKLDIDAHVIVVASGKGANHREKRGNDDARVVEVAVSNPIYVDVGEEGWSPHSPLDDRVETEVQFVEPPVAKPNAEPGRVRLTLRNRGPEAANDKVTLRFVPEGSARVVGPNEQSYSLPYEGAEARVDWKVVFTDEYLKQNFPLNSNYNNTGTFGIRVDRGATPPGRRPSSTWMLVDHHAGSLPAVESVGGVAKALAGEIDYPLGARRGPGLAVMRMGVTGSDLAVHFRVVDKLLQRQKVVWEGSSVELFACMPGRSPRNTDRPGFWYAVNQVYLAPAVGEEPAAGFMRRDDKIVPAPQIRVESRKTAEGYELDALVPLATLKLDVDEINRVVYFGSTFTDVSLLGLEPRPGRFLFDARANAVPSPGAARARPTLFGSAAPHVDSSAFGTMRIEGQVICRVEVVEAPAVGTAPHPGRVRVHLNNRSAAPASDVVTLTVAPSEAAKVEGDPTLKFNLKPGEETSAEFKIVLREDTSSDAVDLIVPRSPGGEVASTPAPRMKIEGRTITRLPALPDLSRVRPALAALPPTAIRLDGKSIGTVRFAIAGSDLAVDAVMVDQKVIQAEPAWKGSSFEIFGAKAPGAAIGQIFLNPAAGPASARGLRSLNGKITPTPAIRLQSRDVEAGYELQALVPLSLLALDEESKQFLLEFQLTSQLDEGKRRTGTAFGSPRAYQDNSIYGRFKVEPARAGE
ncbi:MAG: CehA/McbA family metallohydrolase [Planctomycetota bacterium]|nr:CehA/McbA family metallohydrolase [Planctomycetota bacterium]